MARNPLDFFGLSKDSPNASASNKKKPPTKTPSNDTFFSIAKNKAKLKDPLNKKFCNLTSFADLSKLYDTEPFLTNALYKNGYQTPTIIQSTAIPILMNKRNLIAVAPTGSGKTAAYLTPLLHFISKRRHKNGKTVALIIVPTLDLAKQIKREAVSLASGSRIEVALASDLDFSQNKPRKNIVISTPHFLASHLESSGGMTLKSVRFLVLDESDRLLDRITMSHLDELKGGIESQAENKDSFSTARNSLTDELLAIIRKCTHKKLKKFLFSATLQSHVENTACSLLSNPVRLYLGLRGISSNTVDQSLLFVGTDKSKLFCLKQILDKKFNPPVLIFVQSKRRAKELFEQIEQIGWLYKSAFINSDRSIDSREAILKEFNGGNITILICTDMMARGINFLNVSLVINFDFPPSVGSYIHRVGRTGRCGHGGKAVTFFTERDRPLLKGVAKTISRSGGTVPDWILDSKPVSRSRRKVLKTKPPKRAKIRPINSIK